MQNNDNNNNFETELSCFDELTRAKFTNALNSENPKMTYSEFMNIIETVFETNWFDNYIYFVRSFALIGYMELESWEANAKCWNTINHSPYLTSRYVLEHPHLPLRVMDQPNRFAAFYDDDYQEPRKWSIEDTLRYVMPRYRKENEQYEINHDSIENLVWVLSSNENLTWEFVLAHPELPWNIGWVSQTPLCCDTVSEEILLNLPLGIQKDLTGEYLCLNPKITLDFILNHREEDGWNWDWKQVSCHPDMELRHFEMAMTFGIGLNIRDVCYSTNKITFQEMLESKERHPWDWNLAAKARNDIGLNEILENPELDWNLETLTSYEDEYQPKRFVFELIEAFPEMEWDVDEVTNCLQTTPNLNTIVRRFPHFRWNFEIISTMKGLDLGLLNRFPRANWNFNQIVSRNTHLINNDFVTKYASKIDSELAWYELSTYCNNITLEFMIATADRYHWHLDSIARHRDMTMNLAIENPQLNWPYDLLCENPFHKDRRDYLASQYRNWFVKGGLMQDLMEYVFHPRNLHKFEDLDF